LFQKWQQKLDTHGSKDVLEATAFFLFKNGKLSEPLQRSSDWENQHNLMILKIKK